MANRICYNHSRDEFYYDTIKHDTFSICIPNVMNYYSRSEMITIFKKLNWGSIKDVRFYYNRNSRFKNVVIEFHTWYDDNEDIYVIKKNLYNGEAYKIMYQFPNYWKCYKNKYGG